jgi:hypothetical protein
MIRIGLVWLKQVFVEPRPVLRPHRMHALGATIIDRTPSVILDFLDSAGNEA